MRRTPWRKKLFVNSTAIDPARHESNPVTGPSQSALFPALAGTYLARGLHRTNTQAGAPAPLVMVAPEGCAIPNHGLGRGAPLPPGEGLCFLEGAPRCPGAKLRVRLARTGVAAGTVYQVFEIVNRFHRACAVSGSNPEGSPPSR